MRKTAMPVGPVCSVILFARRQLVYLPQLVKDGEDSLAVLVNCLFKLTIH